MEPLILSSIAAMQMQMPVKVIFTREDDMAFAHPRTPTVQRMRGFIDEDNNLSGTTHDIVGGWMGFYKLGLDFGMMPSLVDGKPEPSPVGDVEAFSVLVRITGMMCLISVCVPSVSTRLKRLSQSGRCAVLPTITLCLLSRALSTRLPRMSGATHSNSDLR